MPESIRLREKLGKQIPEEGVDESKMLNELREIASLKWAFSFKLFQSV